MRGAIFLSIILSTATLTACQPAEKTQTPAAAQTLEIKHADAAKASEYITSTDGVVVLDIRTPAEVSQGHIAGATAIDFKSAEFAQEIAQLDRNTPYVVHCASGGRSTKSLKVFKKLGFTNVTHLDGGIKGWKAAGLPLTSAE